MVSMRKTKFGWRRALGACALLTGAVASLIAFPASAQDKAAIFNIDFVDQSGASAQDWLKAKGFELKEDADNEKKIVLSFAKEALHIQAVKPALGLILHEQDVPGASKLRLHWGVSEYPEGASYEKGVDNEAIMIHVFFGHEKISSGSILVPDSPYFIGFFLCQNDRLETPYKGRYFKKGGRYICVDHDKPNQTAVTEVDLDAEFKSSFGLDQAPAVSGLAIEVDTTHSKNDGKAAAFVKRIEFLE